MNENWQEIFRFQKIQMNFHIFGNNSAILTHILIFTLIFKKLDKISNKQDER